MNINAGIIDQQVRGLAERHKTVLAEAVGISPHDDTPLRSAAFVTLCTKVLLDIEWDEAIEALTEGAGDFGVDAMHVGDVNDGEFTVTLFQCKYYHENLDGNKGFPLSAVEKAVRAVEILFNPEALIGLNPRLQAKIEEIRSLIADGNLPVVRFLLCNNGTQWGQEAKNIIDHKAESFGDRATFEHVNHDTLVRILQSATPVKDRLQFAGKTIVEDFNYARVFLGKVRVSEVARLMNVHGDRLLERNIRRYLGLQGNRVNQGIASTLGDPAGQALFYFYNNGITLICDRFDYNALQPENHLVQVEGLQIINGGQTSKTIQSALAGLSNGMGNLDSAFVLVRLYQIPPDSDQFVHTITYATNSQNPVDLRDLRSNDERQKQIEISMQALGFTYRRHRGDGMPQPTEISVGTSAEAVLAVWRERPHQAKFYRREHFGKLYDEIFTKNLNAAQIVIAVLLFRIAENKRKRPPSGAPPLLQYASWYAAMLMGRYLLNELGLADQRQLDHRTFESARGLVDAKGESYFQQAISDIQKTIDSLYGQREVSLQQLAATFRRGDLMQKLRGVGVSGDGMTA